MTDKIKISYAADSDTTQEIQTFLQSIVPNVEIKEELINEYFEEEANTEIKELLPQELEEADNKFKQEDWNIREEAALFLATSRSPEAIPLLLAHINDPQPEVKHMVIYALGRIRGTDAEVTEVIDTLIEFLTDTDFETRLVAVQALGQIASQFATSTTDTQRIIALFLKCLETEEDWCVKKAITLAFAMIKINDASDRSAVIKALEILRTDESIFVRRAAAYAHNIIKNQQPEEFIDDREDPKLQWLITLWFANGRAAIAPSNLGWRVGEQRELAVAKGENETLSKFAYKDVIIAGQIYQLQIIPEDEPNTYRFRLISNTPGSKIPGGLKLVLVSSQDEAGITDVANTATDALEIKVTLTAEEGIIWKTEPLPENYVEETLWF